MRNNSFAILKLLVVFITTFSMIGLAGPLSGNLHLPTVRIAHACVGIGCTGPYPWVPAGASMDTLRAVIYTDETAEFDDIQSASPSIDLTDSPLPSALISTFTSNSKFQITSSVREAGYYEVQFMLANNFWGCNFNFGNSTCGVEVRQGMAHMFDRAGFAANEPYISGLASALDDPVPSDNVGGLPTANPCNWDASFPQTGTNCVTGGLGGTAYHLAPALGADGFPWLYTPGSSDLNAAAQHFVNAGLATGFNPTTSVLTGISSTVAAHTVNFFIRGSTDVSSPIQLHAGTSLAAQTCYLFTGSYTVPCSPYVSVGPQLGGFPGWTTSTTNVNLSWGVFIRSYEYPTGAQPFDRSLFFTYNSNFVSGISSIKLSGGGVCANSSVPTVSAPDYIYLCDPTYDTLTNNMEFASSMASAVNYGVQAEDRFGSHAYTIPLLEQRAQYGYLNNGWIRADNGSDAGLPNYFTWLNAWNPSPTVPGTIRQGFTRTTNSLSPFLDSTISDSWILGNIYDRLAVPNPASGGQLIYWMALSVFSPPGPWTYAPPPGTTQVLRFTLRTDMFFQDGRKVTAFDAALSYLALKGTGALVGAGAAPMTGITILGPTQFDIDLSSVGPYTLWSLTSLPILPGAYWSNAGASAWTGAISTCVASNASCYPAQYTINDKTPTTTNCALTCVFPAADMNVNVGQTSASYDPLAGHALVGSGPFECGPVTSFGSSTSCSSTGTMNPPVGGSYVLTRFGAGLTPASSISSIYFRSNGNLALYLWSLNTGSIVNDFLNFSVIAGCFGQPVASTGPCAHFQRGIGANGGPVPVGLSQVAIVNRFVGVNWAAPFNWSVSPPAGIIPLNPVLYENTITLNPASVAGCSTPYPTGGYDC